MEAFRQGLRDLGYIEGKKIFVDYRFAEGEYARLPDLAVDLVHLNVNSIVTNTTSPHVQPSKHPNGPNCLCECW
jgi:putative ABC transport system substrate-binding protein